MSEIVNPIVKLIEGETYIAGCDDYLITEDHTFSDIARFIKHHGGAEDVMFMLADMEGRGEK